MPCSEADSLKWTDSCFFSRVMFIYFLNIAQLLVQGVDASGERLLFVVTDQRCLSCLMCGWGWLSAVQLRCCRGVFFDCGKPTDASQLLTSRPSLRSHARPQGGWVSGQLLQWGEWVLLQVNTQVRGTFTLKTGICSRLCFLYLMVSGVHWQRFFSCGKVK